MLFAKVYRVQNFFVSARENLKSTQLFPTFHVLIDMKRVLCTQGGPVKISISIFLYYFLEIRKNFIVIKNLR